VALITLNPEELAKFARAQGIMASDPTVLVTHPKIVERVQRTVDQKNSELQSYAKIKKFAILPEDFTVENGALTPTLKVKRKVISERHQATLDALYR
jgi:long-chain acyl-CoA synthetase